MNILSLLVIIPLLTLLALFTGKGQRFVRTVVTDCNWCARWR